MTTPFYESQRAVSEYLLFHYGRPEEVMPHAFGPRDAVDYPVRCVEECLDARGLPDAAVALDLGCAVGRSTFELARHCQRVTGIDYSERFINVARHLQEQGSITYAHLTEGSLSMPATARVPEAIDRSRVNFLRGDAQALPNDLGTFDVVLMANLIDRLQDPRRCLDQLPALVRPGGQLILSSPYTWLEEYTPRNHWLGGYESGKKTITTLDGLKENLQPHFTLRHTRNLPFVIREHHRKYQWSVAEATTWVRSDFKTQSPT